MKEVFELYVKDLYSAIKVSSAIESAFSGSKLTMPPSMVWENKQGYFLIETNDALYRIYKK